jgi:hypothetical protein
MRRYTDNDSVTLKARAKLLTAVSHVNSYMTQILVTGQLKTLFHEQSMLLILSKFPIEFKTSLP